MSGIVRPNNSGQSGIVSNIETINSDDYVDASIDNEHLADNAVGTAEIADDAVTAAKLANSINTEIAANTAKTGITGGQSSAITANTAKVTNATHTGDVTGGTALTIATDAVDIAMLSASGTASSSTFLRGDNAWAAPGGGPDQAVQSDIEAETNQDTYIPPDLVKFAPSSAKAWCHIAAAGTLSSPDYNVASVTDTGAGDRTIVWDTDFSSAVYSCVSAGLGLTTYNHAVLIKHDAIATGSIQMLTKTYDGSGSQDAVSMTAAFGDQA
jgi:hypothetical protein